MDKPKEEILKRLDARIAELVKWKPHGICKDMTGKPFPEEPPRYSWYLDAMHEAEKILSQDGAWLFSRELSAILGTAGGMGGGELSEHAWHAEAWQKAIALDRALSKTPIV